MPRGIHRPGLPDLHPPGGVPQREMQKRPFISQAKFQKKNEIIQYHFPGRAQHLRVPVRLGGTAVRQAGLQRRVPRGERFLRGGTWERCLVPQIGLGKK